MQLLLRAAELVGAAIGGVIVLALLSAVIGCGFYIGSLVAGSYFVVMQ